MCRVRVCERHQTDHIWPSTRVLSSQNKYSQVTPLYFHENINSGCARARQFPRIRRSRPAERQEKKHNARFCGFSSSQSSECLKNGQKSFCSSRSSSNTPSQHQHNHNQSIADTRQHWTIVLQQPSPPVLLARAWADREMDWVGWTNGEDEWASRGLSYRSFPQ